MTHLPLIRSLWCEGLRPIISFSTTLIVSADSTVRVCKGAHRLNARRQIWRCTSSPGCTEGFPSLNSPSSPAVLQSPALPAASPPVMTYVTMSPKCELSVSSRTLWAPRFVLLAAEERDEAQGWLIWGVRCGTHTNLVRIVIVVSLEFHSTLCCAAKQYISVCSTDRLILDLDQKGSAMNSLTDRGYLIRHKAYGGQPL